MNQKKIYPSYMLILPLAVFLIFFVLPSTIGYFYAFTDWNQYNTSDLQFVGLKNFAEILDNRSLMTAFVNTIIFAVVKTVGVTVLGFVFALALNRKLKTRNVLRTIYFIPAIFSALIVGLIFAALFDYHTGVVNQALIALRLEEWTQQWLGLRIPALVTINLAEIWRSLGYAMVITLAGLQSISSDYLEAAMVDGATGWVRFKSIILPLIMPSVNVNILFSLIYGLKMFDLVYVMTQGGPGHDTETFGTLIMNEMSQGRFAQSVAVNFVFTILLVIVAIAYQKFSARWEDID
ncbi:MAG: sugar ABC transporter permease [Butyricicoccus pullicaecorum]|nr:sugar ABC transporter permease [Butyricicoccus pullicaecorum]MDO4668846.1 sugar ABC transporter permease [Butyricicoccus pullicaecorum]